MSSNSLFSTSSSGKCTECSKSINKKNIFTCSDCSELFCKEHIRTNPSDLALFCIKCFTKNLIKEAEEEMQDEYILVEKEKNRLKNQIKKSKKDRNDKIQAIDHLQKLLDTNKLKYEKNIENIKQKISEEESNERNIISTFESLKVTIEDSMKQCKNAEEKLETTKDEFIQTKAETELIKEENTNIQNQIQEINGRMKDAVIYERLRNLACDQCKLKIKSTFRQMILNGNQGRGSIIQSVLAYRASLRKNSAKVSKQNSINPAISKNESCCNCFIQ